MPKREEEESGENEKEEEAREVEEDHSEDDQGESEDEDEEGPTVTWDMSHLTEKEKEKEEKRMEEDITFNVTPEASVHTPENRSNPVPGTKAPEPPKLKKKRCNSKRAQEVRKAKNPSPSLQGIAVTNKILHD